jgi:hypothetical protein
VWHTHHWESGWEAVKITWGADWSVSLGAGDHRGCPSQAGVLKLRSYVGQRWRWTKTLVLGEGLLVMGAVVGGVDGAAVSYCLIVLLSC